VKTEDSADPKTNGKNEELPASLIADRERRKRVREREAQIPPDCEPTYRQMYQGRWPDPFRVALDICLTFRSGEAQIRRIIGEYAAATARGLSVEAVRVDDLPFPDFETALVTQTEAVAYRLRNELLFKDRRAETAGIIDYHHWRDLSAALGIDPGYTLWKARQTLDVVFPFGPADKPTYWIVMPGNNVLPSVWHKQITQRREVDAWIEEGVIEPA
jgi:hypothetical protein